MDEILQIINQLEGYKWIMAQLMYGAGLRVMECVRLRVKDFAAQFCNPFAGSRI
jgi:site-specific recombinase XerD